MESNEQPVVTNQERNGLNILAGLIQKQFDAHQAEGERMRLAKQSRGRDHLEDFNETLEALTEARRARHSHLTADMANRLEAVSYIQQTMRHRPGAKVAA